MGARPRVGKSVLSPVAPVSRARIGALPEPRVKPKCTHHMENGWSWVWLVCWLGAPGIGVQEEEKERLGDQ